MSWKQCKFNICADLYRLDGEVTARTFLRKFFGFDPGFRFLTVLRLCAWTKSIGFGGKVLYYPLRLVFRHLQYKYGYSIPYNTSIGPGLYLGHFGGVVISAEASIGWNCNINHGVTIGITYGGKHPGVPVIGDRVYIGPGAKVIGGVTIGADVAIGANCVVSTDIPASSVVVGIPGRVVSDRGSIDYVVNTVNSPFDTEDL